MNRNISIVSVFLIIGLSMLFQPAMLCGGPAPGVGTPGQMVKKEFNPQVMRALGEFRGKHVAKIKRVKWNPERTRIKTLRGMPLSLPFSGSPEDAAKHFLSDNAALFRLDQEFNDLELDVGATRKSSVSNSIHYKQIFGGLPVFNGGVSVHLRGDDNSVFLVHNYYMPNIDISTTPVLSENECIGLATKDLQQRYDFRKDESGEYLSFKGAEFIFEFTEKPQPQLGIFEHKGKPCLVYKFFLMIEPLILEKFMIDAHTGVILQSGNLVQFDERSDFESALNNSTESVDGTGKVFDPNPVNTLGDISLRDDMGGSPDADAPIFDAAYITHPLFELRSILGLKFLFGPFVKVTDWAQLPWHILETPLFGYIFTISGNFDYTRNPNQFEHVMVYYHIDKNQRYIQSLGFQNINKRRITADPHGVYGLDQSVYYPSPPGAGFLSFGEGGVDDAEDADIILHEYGHAIQDNASDGKYIGLCNTEASAMAEGFGDYWAASCNYDISITNGFDPACIGEWDSTYDNLPCLRRVDSTKHYSDKSGECHEDGEIWSAALWELFMHPLVGKTVTDTIVLQSHSYVPVNPTFVDGVEALLDADINKYGGIHKDIICSITTNRGFDCNECITGTWTDNFGFIWNLTQTGTSISGTVNTSRCGSYNVTGSYNDPQIILTATKPSPPPDCCMSFTYNGTISTCSGGSGTWINPCALQGNWSMSKDGVGPLIQLETEGPFPCSGSN